MWSHYADNHNGICVEFDTGKIETEKLRSVTYDTPRGIRISQLAEWIKSENIDERLEVLSRYFYSKAPQWKYEQEWRDVTEHFGVHSSPLNISAIYFGMRCDPAVVDTLVRLYINSETTPEFIQVDSSGINFDLIKRDVEVDRITQVGINNSMAFAFDNLILDKSEEFDDGA